MPAYNNVSLQGPPQAPSYNAPNVGMQLGALLGSLPADYLQGREIKQKLAMMQPVTGNPMDPANIIQQLNQAGGLGAVAPQLQTLIDAQNLRTNPWPLQSGQGQQTQTMPQGPSTTPGLSSAGTDNKGQDSVASLASETFGDQDATALNYRGQPLNAISRVASALGVDPGQGLTPQQAQQARQGFSRLSQAVGQPQQASAESQDQPAPSTTQAAPQQPMPAGLPPQMQQQVQQLTRERDILRSEAARLGVVPRYAERAKQLGDAANDRQAQIQQITGVAAKNAELTDPQKNALASGKPSPFAYATDLEAGKAVAAAKGKDMADVINAGGKPARSTINDLDVIADAIKHGGNNMVFGPGSEYWQKAKQVLNNVFPQAALGEADTVVKFNTLLASAAAKSFTSRPTQYELKAMQAANPGMMASKQGTIALINILRQSAQQDVELGQLAGRTNNPNEWASQRDLYYAEHPLLSPFTNKPLRPPQVPASVKTHADFNKWGSDFHLSKGDPIRQPNGQLKVFVPMQ